MFPGIVKFDDNNKALFDHCKPRYEYFNGKKIEHSIGRFHFNDQKSMMSLIVERQNRDFIALCHSIRGAPMVPPTSYKIYYYLIG